MKILKKDPAQQNPLRTNEKFLPCRETSDETRETGVAKPTPSVR
jgi:hypothetical protein